MFNRNPTPAKLTAALPLNRTDSIAYASTSASFGAVTMFNRNPAPAMLAAALPLNRTDPVADFSITTSSEYRATTMFSRNATPAMLAAAFPFSQTDPVADISAAASSYVCGEFKEGCFIKDVKPASTLPGHPRT